MTFEWDEKKNKENLKKHGISFDLAVRVFLDTNAVDRMQIAHDDEERRETIGVAYGAMILFVAYASRDHEGEELIRIISARRADSYERRQYEENLKNSKEAF
jgi:uncharacterized DUF497 family protein